MRYTADMQALFRFFRFSLVSACTLSLDLLLLYTATTFLHVPYYISTPFSFAVAESINYFISRAFVFAGTTRPIHHGYVYFIIAGGIGALATTGLVVLLVSYGHFYFVYARMLVALLIGVANYLFNLYVNFGVVGQHNERTPR